LSKEVVESVAFLVHKHLMISHLALKYDTRDPQLVAKFAEDVGTPERLDLLYLLTCADLAAVGPGVLNNWKIEILSELYFAASRQLAAARGIPIEQQREGYRRVVWDRFRPEEQNDSWIAEQLTSFPEPYVSRWPAAKVVETLRRLRTLSPRSGVAWGNYLPETDTLEFIAGIDQGVGRAIFSSMAGALTSQRMQILAAETNTLVGGLLLLRYVAHEPESPGPPEDGRLESISRALVASIDSDEPPKFPKILGREQQAAGAVLTAQPNLVRVNTDIADECTVLEVFTIDRRGLLYHLARTLHDLGLVIRFAKIGTYVDQVVDVFYVTERDGSKPTQPERLGEICSALEAVIAPSAVGV
jgi:[protein-PII] uridylyltransferase